MSNKFNYSRIIRNIVAAVEYSSQTDTAMTKACVNILSTIEKYVYVHEDGSVSFMLATFKKNVTPDEQALLSAANKWTEEHAEEVFQWERKVAYKSPVRISTEEE